MGLFKSITKAAKKVAKAPTKVLKKVVKVAAKPVKSVSKVMANSGIAGVSNIGKATGKAAGQAEAETNRTTDRADSSMDQVADLSQKFASSGLQSTRDMYSNAASDALQMGKNLSQGDLKGMAGTALSSYDNTKSNILNQAQNVNDAGSGVIGAAGEGTGSSELSRLGSNLQNEGNKGIDQYGGMAVDMAGNYVTGGGLAAGQAMAGSLQQGGVGGLLKSDNLKNMATSYAASQAGIDPSMLQGGMSLAQGGNIQDAAIRAAGQDPNMIRAGMGLAKGQLDVNALKQAGLGAAGSYAGSQYNIDPRLMQAGTSLAQGGNLQDMGKQYAMQQAGISPEIQDQINMGASAIRNPSSLAQQQLGNNMNFKGVLKQGSEAANNLKAGKLQALLDSKAQMQQAANSALDPNMLKNVKQYQDMLKDPSLDGATRDRIEGELTRLTGGAESTVGPRGESPGMWDKFKGMFSSEEAPAQGTPEYYRAQEEAYAKSQQPEGPGFMDKFKGGIKSLGKGIGGVASGIANAASDNPEMAAALTQTAGAAGAFAFREKALKEQQDQLGKQLEEARGYSAEQQATPEAYKEMAAGGPTSKYTQEMMGAARDAGQIAQSGRSAALERMSRMGRGGGELESMLSGAQAGANRYADTSRAALSRDQDLRIGAEDKMSAIDQFNTQQRQSAQAQRLNMTQGLQGQQRAYTGQEGQQRAEITAGAADALAGAGLAASQRKSQNQAIDRQNEQALALERLRNPPQQVPVQQAPVANVPVPNVLQKPVQRAPANQALAPMPIVQPKAIKKKVVNPLKPWSPSMAPAKPFSLDRPEEE